MSTFFERFTLMFTSPSGPGSGQEAPGLGGPDELLGRYSYAARSVLLWTSLITTLVLAALSGQSPPPPPFKYTNGEIADLCPTGITPTDETFSIWGIIYMWQVLYAIWQTWPSQRNHPQLGRLALYNSAAYACSCAWLIAIGNKYFFLAQLIIVLYALCLAYAYYYLAVGLVPVNFIETFFCRVALSIHLSWVLLATLLGFNLTLSCGFGWTPTVDFNVMCLMVATLLCVYVQLTRADIPYAAVVIWAALGIKANNPAKPTQCFSDVLFWSAIVSAILGKVLQWNLGFSNVEGQSTSVDLVLGRVQADRLAANRYRLVATEDPIATDFAQNRRGGHATPAHMPLTEQ